MHEKETTRKRIKNNEYSYFNQQAQIKNRFFHAFFKFFLFSIAYARTHTRTP